MAKNKSRLFKVFATCDMPMKIRNAYIAAIGPMESSHMYTWVFADNTGERYTSEYCRLVNEWFKSHGATDEDKSVIVMRGYFHDI